MASERILAIFAHPDDESILAGGTLAACADAGAHVEVLSVTRGENGDIADPGMASRDNLGDVRERELRTAAGALGVSAVECLGYPDGELEWIDPEEIATSVGRRIRALQPTILLTFGAEGLYWHEDHRTVHRTVHRAVEALPPAARPWVYHATWPDGHMLALVEAVRSRGTEPELWGLHPSDFGAPPDSITTVLDVRAALQRKLVALRSHRTQLPQRHLFDLIDDELAAEFLGVEFFAVAHQPARGDLLAAVIASCSGGAQWAYPVGRR